MAALIRVEAPAWVSSARDIDYRPIYLGGGGGAGAMEVEGIDVRQMWRARGEDESRAAVSRPAAEAVVGTGEGSRVASAGERGDNRGGDRSSEERKKLEP